MQASKNFTDEEMSCPCCGVFGVKPIFLEKLQELRDLFGEPIAINSAYRCEKHNAEIGGHKNSQHMLGLAVDISCHDSAKRFRLINIALGLGFKGIGVAPSFLHLDYRANMIGNLWFY